MNNKGEMDTIKIVSGVILILLVLAIMIFIFYNQTSQGTTQLDDFFGKASGTFKGEDCTLVGKCLQSGCISADDNEVWAPVKPNTKDCIDKGEQCCRFVRRISDQSSE